MDEEKVQAIINQIGKSRAVGFARPDLAIS